MPGATDPDPAGHPRRHYSPARRAAPPMTREQPRGTRASPSPGNRRRTPLRTAGTNSGDEHHWTTPRPCRPRLLDSILVFKGMAAPIGTASTTLMTRRRTSFLGAAYCVGQCLMLQRGAASMGISMTVTCPTATAPGEQFSCHRSVHQTRTPSDGSVAVRLDEQQVL